MYSVPKEPKRKFMLRPLEERRLNELSRGVHAVVYRLELEGLSKYRPLENHI